MSDIDEFTELIDGNFARVDLVGKAANGVPRFLIAKSAADVGAQHGVLEQAVVRDLVEKATPSTPVSEEPTLNTITKATDLNAGGNVLVGDDGGTPGSAEWEQVDADTATKWVSILARAKNAVMCLQDRESAESFEAGEADLDTAWSLSDCISAIDCAIECLAPFAVSEAAEAARQEDIGILKAAFALAEDPFPLTTIEGLMPVLKAGRTLSAANESKIRSAADALQQVLSSLPAAPEGAVMKETEKVAKADVGAPVSGTTQDMVDQEAFDGSKVGLPHGDDEQNQSNEGNAVTAADNPVAVPTDVKTLSGLAGTQDDIKGTDMMVGDAAVDQGVVTKASPQQAVYNSAGKLLGTVDPGKITELIAEDGDDAAGSVDTDDSGDAPEASADETSDGAADATPPADMDPAPSGTAGTPAEGVAKAELSEVIKEALAQRDAENASVVKALEDRLAYLEAPARSRVLANGVLPPKHMMRGMDEGRESVDIAKAEELRGRLDVTHGAEERMAIEKEMNANAAEAFQALRDAQRR